MIKYYRYSLVFVGDSYNVDLDKFEKNYLSKIEVVVSDEDKDKVLKILNFKKSKNFFNEVKDETLKSILVNYKFMGYSFKNHSSLNKNIVIANYLSKNIVEK